MFKRQIFFKAETKDSVYTELCNKMKGQGVFFACGNCDDKWIMGKWDDEVDFFAWCVAMGIATPAETNSSKKK